MSVVLKISRFKTDVPEIEKERILIDEWMEYVVDNEGLYEVKKGSIARDAYSGDTWIWEDPSPGTVELRLSDKNLTYYIYYSRGSISIPAPHSPDEPIWRELEKIVEAFSAVLYDEEGKVLSSADKRYQEGTYLP